MTVIASVEAIALVAIVYLMLRAQRANETAWTAERYELLNRIQRPEMVSLPAGEPFAWPEDNEPDDLALVGTIADLKEDE